MRHHTIVRHTRRWLLAWAACHGLLFAANGEDEDVLGEPAFPKELVKAGDKMRQELKTNLEALARDKASALEALTFLKKHRFIKLLVRVVEYHPIDEIRAVAAEGLAEIDAYEAFPHLDRAFVERWKRQQKLQQMGWGWRFDDASRAFQARTNRIGNAAIELRRRYHELPKYQVRLFTKEEMEQFKQGKAPKWLKIRPPVEGMTEDERALRRRKEKAENERLRRRNQQPATEHAAPPAAIPEPTGLDKVPKSKRFDWLLDGMERDHACFEYVKLKYFTLPTVRPGMFPDPSPTAGEALKIVARRLREHERADFADIDAEERRRIVAAYLTVLGALGRHDEMLAAHKGLHQKGLSGPNGGYAAWQIVHGDPDWNFIVDTVEFWAIDEDVFTR